MPLELIDPLWSSQTAAPYENETGIRDAFSWSLSNQSKEWICTWLNIKLHLSNISKWRQYYSLFSPPIFSKGLSNQVNATINPMPARSWDGLLYQKDKTCQKFTLIISQRFLEEEKMKTIITYNPPTFLFYFSLFSFSLCSFLFVCEGAEATGREYILITFETCMLDNNMLWVTTTMWWKYNGENKGICLHCMQVNKGKFYLHLGAKLQGWLTYMTFCTVWLLFGFFRPYKCKDLQDNNFWLFLSMNFQINYSISNNYKLQGPQPTAINLLATVWTWAF